MLPTLPQEDSEGFRSSRWRVLLVDDQVAVREMVAMVLDREGRFAVVAETASGMNALPLYERHRPDLVIVGLSLKEMNGPELIKELRKLEPTPRILVFSGSKNLELLWAGIEARPHGFVHKTESLETFRQACGAIVQGISFMSPFATRLVDEIQHQARPESVLTPKQRTVLQMVAEGKSTKEVAQRLALSPKTVEHYRNQIMQRLGVRDVASLTRYAVKAGLVD